MLNVFFFSGNGLYNEIKYKYEIRLQNYSLQQKVWDRKVMFCKLSILWSKWPWLAYQPQGPGWFAWSDDELWGVLQDNELRAQENCKEEQPDDHPLLSKVHTA